MRTRGVCPQRAETVHQTKTFEVQGLGRVVLVLVNTLNQSLTVVFVVALVCAFEKCLTGGSVMLGVAPPVHIFPLRLALGFHLHMSQSLPSTFFLTFLSLSSHFLTQSSSSPSRWSSAPSRPLFWPASPKHQELLSFFLWNFFCNLVQPLDLLLWLQSAVQPQHPELVFQNCTWTLTVLLFHKKKKDLRLPGSVPELWIFTF